MWQLELDPYRPTPMKSILVLVAAAAAFLSGCSSPAARHDYRVDRRVDRRDHVETRVDNRHDVRYDRRSDRYDRVNDRYY